MARSGSARLAASQTETVGLYHGDMQSPDPLLELEDKFDEIVQTERWIGTRAERDQLEGR